MSTIKDIYDIIKDIREIAKKQKNMEMTELVISMQEKFFDVREEIENLREENQSLKAEIQQLKSSTSIDADLELQTGGYYIRKSEQAQEKAIRYCARCWNVEHKLIPYTRAPGAKRICNNCKGQLH